MLVAKNGVDGVYTADPRTNPDAVRLEEISYQEALVQGLKVVDSVTRVLQGEHIGTLVRP